MRRILVENARRKKRLKHSGGIARQELHESEIAAPADSSDRVALVICCAMETQLVIRH